MKSYTITVNGNVYDVTVEENGMGSTTQAAPRRVASAPAVSAPVASAPAAAKAAPAPAPAKSAGAGNIKIEAGASGKVFKIDAAPGTTVKRGDSIMILEIMKMETPVVAPCDGTVASIEVAVGDSVDGGALLATMNE